MTAAVRSMPLDSWPYSDFSVKRPPFRMSPLAAGSLCRLAGEAQTEIERLRAADSTSAGCMSWSRGSNKAKLVLIDKQLSSVSRFLRQFQLDQVSAWGEGRLQVVADQVTLLWASFLRQDAKYQGLGRTLQALSTQVASVSQYQQLPVIKEEDLQEGQERCSGSSRS